MLKKDEVFRNVKTIDGHDFSKYEISNYGNIKSLYVNRYIKSYYDLDGYRVITLVNKNKQRKRMRIHRLVAYTFVDGYSKQKCVVNHKDENKSNNYFKNLEWITDKDNTIHSLGKRVQCINPKTNEIIKTYRSVKCALRDMNKSIKSTSIYQCCNGKYNYAYGYKWKYVTK